MRGTPSKRSLVALILSGVLIGAMFVGTAGAGITTNVNHSWFHIKRKADPYYGTTEYYRSAPISVADGGIAYGEYICPGSTYPTGGGVYTQAANMSIEASYPVDLDSSSTGAGRDGWGAYVRNNSGGTSTFVVYAICQYAAFQPGNYSDGTLSR